MKRDWDFKEHKFFTFREVDQIWFDDLQEDMFFNLIKISIENEQLEETLRQIKFYLSLSSIPTNNEETLAERKQQIHYWAFEVSKVIKSFKDGKGKDLTGGQELICNTIHDYLLSFVKDLHIRKSLQLEKLPEECYRIRLPEIYNSAIEVLSVDSNKIGFKFKGTEFGRTKYNFYVLIAFFYSIGILRAEYYQFEKMSDVYENLNKWNALMTKKTMKDYLKKKSFNPTHEEYAKRTLTFINDKFRDNSINERLVKEGHINSISESTFQWLDDKILNYFYLYYDNLNFKEILRIKNESEISFKDEKAHILFKIRNFLKRFK